MHRVCTCLVKPAAVRPAKLPVMPYEFKYLVEMGVLEEYTANGMRISFSSIVCHGAGYQVVVPVRCGAGNPTGEDVMEVSMARWMSWAGMPYQVFMDQARSNLAYVRTQLIERGAHCDFASLEQHHHLGRCERAGGV